MKFFKILKQILIYGAVFFLPLFFLPVTQEYVYTAKVFGLVAVTLLLILIGSIEVVATRRIGWKKYALDTVVLLFMAAAGISVLFASPNKVEAVLNVNYGLTTILFGGLFYFIVTQNRTIISKQTVARLLTLSGSIVALISVVMYFQPFRNITVPVSLQFLQNPMFSPVGSVYDTIVFLLLIILVQVVVMFQNSQKEHVSVQKSFTKALPILIVLLAGLGARVLGIFTNPNNTAIILPPVGISWYAAVETLKNPITALIGSGLDNFSSVFSQVKDITYNQGALWQISTFTLSRSAILQIITESGLFALVAFLLICYQLMQSAKHAIGAAGSALALFFFLAFLLLPFNITTFFLLMVVAGLFAHAQGEVDVALDKVMPVVIGIFLVGLGVTIAGFYLYGRAYAAQLMYQQAAYAVNKNDFVGAYNAMQLSIQDNPYNEDVRTNFSRLNMQFAINALSIKQQQKQQLTEQERLTVIQAIQAAIAEAKSVVTLNQQRATNWENLALIYRSIINLAQGADTWTVSSYQRAIVLDPQNPVYRLSLGGVYYALGDYDNAVQLFQQAIGLKGDWANAYYNLAWAHAQKKDYSAAVSTMQSVISLLDPVKDKADYDRAQSDLAEFTKMLPKAQTTPAPVAQEKPKQLNLPTPPVATLSPKLQLPKEASPGAK